jgi:hypothetical protein
MFFPVQSIGFLLAGIGILVTLTNKQSASALAVAPPLFKGTFVFVGLMVAGLGLMDVGLCIIAFKMKKQQAATIAAFAVSFVCCLCMGYLSSQNFEQAAMNWIAEGVNVVGQGLFFLGAYLMHKNGLDKFQIREGERV